MNVVIDPRMAERRRVVREHGARRRLRWVVLLVIAAALAAAGYWVIHSPLLAVRSITVSGMDVGRGLELAAAGGLDAGEPILFVPAGSVEDTLLADPWVETARVDVRWPHVG